MTDDARPRITRPDSVAPTSTRRQASRDRVLVIDDSDDSRCRTVTVLGNAGYVAFEQPSAIGATRLLVRHSIPAVVIDVGMPGLSCVKLVDLLRNNPRLDGLVIVVITSVETPRQLWQECLVDVDAVVLREQAETRLVPTLQRLLRTSGFHQKAPILGVAATGSGGD